MLKKIVNKANQSYEKNEGFHPVFFLMRKHLWTLAGMSHFTPLTFTLILLRRTRETFCQSEGV